MTKLSSLSIFFPTFNEEENIKIAVNRALKVAPEVSKKFEVIVVDDGSLDKTAEVTNQLSKTYPEVRLVSHSKNRGYGGALKTGFYESKYDYITYMDSDNQFDFADLKKLVEKMEETDSDIVVGFRIKRADVFVRRLNGKMWNLMVSMLLSLPIKDIDCGFKLIKREVLLKIPKLESNGATISAELLVKAKKKRFKISQIGLDHKSRQFGTATGGNPLHIFRAFADLILLLPKI